MNYCKYILLTLMLGASCIYFHPRRKAEKPTLRTFIAKVKITQRILQGFSRAITRDMTLSYPTATCSITSKFKKRLKATSQNYIKGIKKLSTCATFLFVAGKHIFVEVLSPKLYDVHSNNCTVFTSKAIGTSDLLDLNCTEQRSYEVITMKTVEERLNVNMYYNFYMGTFTFTQEHLMDKDKNLDQLQVKLGFIHVIKDASIQPNGDVFSCNTYISILRCKWTIPSSLDFDAPVYDKVFSISQYWGSGYFHFLVESLPRIILALTFLLKNEDIKIHVTANTFLTRIYLRELGINENRIVTNHVQARLSYIPGGTACGRGVYYSNQYFVNSYEERTTKGV